MSPNKALMLGFMNKVVLACFALAIGGCAIYPTSRTYFDPDLSDGTPAASMGCGYHRAREDSLEREIADLRLKVTPRFEDRKPLGLTVWLVDQDGSAELNGNQITVQTSDKTFMAVSVDPGERAPRNKTPYFEKWVNVTFPAEAGAASAISLVFRSGSLRKNGKIIEVQQFRFTKVTKIDIYYLSINC